MITGGGLVVKALEDAGIELALGIPAIHNLPIYDALYDSSLLKKVSVKHEQAAGFMAIGAAYASGKLAACIIGSGPGLPTCLLPLPKLFWIHCR